MTVTEALRRRVSTRAFLPTPLAVNLVREIVEAARWAPSGGNLQPWKLIVVSGAAQAAVKALLAAHRGLFRDEAGERPIYPAQLWEPYRSRRYQLGEDLYALLGIPRQDSARRLAQLARNFDFFGAPVGLFFVIDRRMGHGQWAHLGMFMQSLALAATERGVASCFQEIWAQLRRTLEAHFALPADEMVYCGMALGHADPDAPINRLRAGRAALDEFARFHFD